MERKENAESLNRRLTEIAQTCAAQIIQHKKSDRPLLVAITGDSGSGKSFYSRLIQQELRRRGEQFTAVDHDSFLISRADREPMKTEYYEDGEFSGKSKWEILENMFRLDVYKKVIDTLRGDQETEYHPYRRETGTVSEDTTSIEPQPIIIFDTSMMLDEMDLVIAIDVDMETIIERKKERDSDIRTPQEIEDMHRQVQGYYWQRERPEDPDIVIDNNDFANPSVKVCNL